jgi:hypothetical protein
MRQRSLADALQPSQAKIALKAPRLSPPVKSRLPTSNRREKSERIHGFFIAAASFDCAKFQA